jgi:TetR/AcrR family transcriptional regulator, fatty acid metabolism regulator protein
MTTTAPRSKEEIVQEYRIQSIQDAAMRVISRKGMAAATMKDIADEAGIAKGTIYLYFHDRDELVEKTFEGAISQLLRKLQQALAVEAPFEEQLRHIVRTQVEFFREHREFFRLYSSLRFPEGNAHQQKRHRRTCQPQYLAHREEMSRFLREAMERGEVRRMDPDRLALFLIEGTNAIIIQRVSEETSPAEEADVELIASTILQGIANDITRPDAADHRAASRRK